MLVYYVNIPYHNGSPFSRSSAMVRYPSKSTTTSISYQVYCHQLETKVATECLNKPTFYKRFYRPNGDNVTASKQYYELDTVEHDEFIMSQPLLAV